MGTHHCLQSSAQMKGSNEFRKKRIGCVLKGLYATQVTFIVVKRVPGGYWLGAAEINNILTLLQGDR